MGFNRFLLDIKTERTMGFLDRLLQAERPDMPPDWKSLERDEQWLDLIENSRDQPVAVFKHSARCGVSSMALWQLTSEWPFDPAELQVWYLDIFRHRPLSNRIAQQTGIVHQSPQLLLFRDGRVDFHTSHHGISISWLRDALYALPPKDINPTNL